MKKKEFQKLYYTYEELVEILNLMADFEFMYKGVGYNITWNGRAKVLQGIDFWDNNAKEYATGEELLLNHTMPDGVRVIDALKSEDVDCV